MRNQNYFIALSSDSDLFDLFSIVDVSFAFGTCVGIYSRWISGHLLQSAQPLLQLLLPPPPPPSPIHSTPSSSSSSLSLRSFQMITTAPNTPWRDRLRLEVLPGQGQIWRAYTELQTRSDDQYTAAENQSRSSIIAFFFS